MTKADHQIPETFYFITISYVLAELWIFFYFVCFSWRVFIRKGSFSAKVKQHGNASFFAFFIKLDLIWPKFCLKSQHFLSVDFQWNLLEDSININNFCCNPVFLKKNGKTSKNCFLGHNLHYKWASWAMPKMKNNFFSINNKSRSSAFRTFSFYQNIMFWLSHESLSILCGAFYQKRVISFFQLKQLQAGWRGGGEVNNRQNLLSMTNYLSTVP